MKGIIREILLGNEAIREYSTVTITGDIKEKVYLRTKKNIFDVSKNQWLLCLDPVVFGIWITDRELIADSNETQDYGLFFGSSINSNAENIERKSVAVLGLSLFDKIEEKDGTLFLLKLEKSRIQHVSPIKALLIYHRYYKKPGFPFKKLKSFASAYSYPRKVRVVSIRQDNYYNIFPMDLLGEISDSKRFVFGLRHTNVALSKIIESGKLVASEVSFEHKETIYQLGKHHGVSPPSLDSLPFKTIQSDHFGFYIPEWADRYTEIKITRTMSLGSHMLLWGEAVNEKILKMSSGHLYHIHFLHYLYQKRKGYAYPLV
jgi:flavin reductase (DIM6/NTAB) family NADH-FMN oxidoreductase RutF